MAMEAEKQRLRNSARGQLTIDSELALERDLARAETSEDLERISEWLDDAAAACDEEELFGD